MDILMHNVGLLAEQNLFLAYAIIFFVSIIAGNIAEFAAIWLVLGGGFGVWGMFYLAITVFLADVVGNLTWYSMGHALRGTRLGNFIKNRLPYHEKIEAGVQKHSERLILLSRFIYGLSFPIIFLVGWSGMVLKEYIRSSMIATGVWLPTFFVVAYGLISSLNLLQATVIWKRIELAVVALLLLFFFMQYVVGKVFRKYFLKNGDGGGL